MHVAIQEVSSCVKKLEIEIPPETVNEELDKAYKKLGRTVKVDGFRQGKVPRKILEGLYKNSVDQEVLQKLIPESCEEALKEKGIQAARTPEVGGEIKLSKDQPLKFSVTVEIIPSIDLKPYEGLKFTKKIVNISEENLLAALRNIQENSAEYEITPDALAEKGDFLIMDWQAEAEGHTLTTKSKENFTMILGGSVFGPQAEEVLIGAKAGEEKDAAVFFPADYKQKEWAGLTVRFRFVIKELKKKKIPNLDDDFAKSLGYENLDDLKSKLFKHLEELEERRSSSDLSQDIISTLVQDNPIDAPPILVENKTRQLILDLKERLKMQGLGEPDLDVDKLKENYKKSAENMVKGELILQKIAEAENLAVSEEEINHELEAMPRPKDRSVKSIKDTMTKNGSLENFRMNLLLEKALNLVKAKSQIDILKGSREELFPQKTEAIPASDRAEESREESSE